MNNQGIECANCGERNLMSDTVCSHCGKELVKENTKKCPQCDVMISAEREYCKLCSIRRAKSGAVGCSYAISILLFIIGIIFMFFNWRVGITLLIISILLWVVVFILVKVRYSKIMKKYPIRKEVPL